MKLSPTFYLAVLVVLLTHFLYYPKWSKGGTEATISWDVSGYYMYLPASLIYQDIKGCGFKDSILQNYGPTPNFQQAFVHEASGNYVMKYSMGQAISFLPAFGLAHLYAKSTAYPADGFSFPYQLAISLGSLFWALLGLYYLRKFLLFFYRPKVVDWSILGLVLGSNYLNYSAIDGAMTHNTLFTLYSLLLYVTVRFYQQPSYLKGAAIGALVGWAALIRPTEIIACIIPLAWGLQPWLGKELKQRLQFVAQHFGKLLLAVLITAFIGSFQLMYWKYATGEWIVYSYQDQGFSWLSPHLHAGFLSYKSGWLTYSPFMLLPLLGFWPFFKQQRSLFAAVFAFSLLFIYITFAWDIWWYGGSLGQRAMVQAYPVLALPLAALVHWLSQQKLWLKLPVFAFVLLSFYANLWFTHQAHKGGLLRPGEMTKAYYWATLFRYDKDPERLKLLDGVRQLKKGELKEASLVYSDTSWQAQLDQNQQFAPIISLALPKMPEKEGLRVSILAQIMGPKEWEFWWMTQFTVSLKKEGQLIDEQMFRLQRQIEEGEEKRLYMDLPVQGADSLEIKFWNADGKKAIRLSQPEVWRYVLD